MNIVNYGGGTNSTAMLIGMWLHEIPVDLITFADPGGEHPHTYRYLEIFGKWLQDHGMPEITVVHAVDREGKRLKLYQECIQRHTLPPIAFGFKTCSQKYKATPQDKLLNHDPRCQEIWKSGGRVDKWIGYDAGETKRVQCAKAYDEHDRKFKRHFPLYEWGWTREECGRVIQRAGLPKPGKSSCFFCPSMKKPEIIQLYETEPQLFEKARQLEQNARDLTAVRGLGRSWSWQELIAVYEQNKAFDAAQLDLFADENLSCGCIDPCGCYDG